MNIELLPKDQIQKVLTQDMCDIDLEFLGFMDIYENLSKIIPKHFTIIDFGCAYNPQCFLFKEHKQFIAVDDGKLIRFQSENCIIFEKPIREFIDEELSILNLDLEETFAICSYVPCKEVHKKLIRNIFPNLFVYYPSNKNERLVIRKKMFENRSKI